MADTKSLEPIQLAAMPDPVPIGESGLGGSTNAGSCFFFAPSVSNPRLCRAADVASFWRPKLRAIAFLSMIARSDVGDARAKIGRSATQPLFRRPTDHGIGLSHERPHPSQSKSDDLRAAEPLAHPDRSDRIAIPAVAQKDRAV